MIDNTADKAGIILRTIIEVEQVLTKVTNTKHLYIRLIDTKTGTGSIESKANNLVSERHHSMGITGIREREYVRDI